MSGAPIFGLGGYPVRLRLPKSVAEKLIGLNKKDHRTGVIQDYEQTLNGDLDKFVEASVFIKGRTTA